MHNARYQQRPVHIGVDPKKLIDAQALLGKRPKIPTVEKCLPRQGPRCTRMCGNKQYISIRISSSLMYIPRAVQEGSGGKVRRA